MGYGFAAALLIAASISAANANAIGGASYIGVSVTIPTSELVSCSMLGGNGTSHTLGTNPTASRSSDTPTCSSNTSGSTTIDFGDASVAGDTGAFLYPESYVNATSDVDNVVFVNGLSFASASTLTFGLTGDFYAHSDTDVVAADLTRNLFGGTETAWSMYIFRIAAYSAQTAEWSYYPLLFDGFTLSSGDAGTLSGSLPASYSIPVLSGSYLFEFSSFLYTEDTSAYEIPEPGTLVLLGFGMLGLGRSRFTGRWAR